MPRPVERASEWWARLRPRIRALLLIVLALLAVVLTELRIHSASARWGGAAVTVLVASEHLPVGAHPVVEPIAYPPRVVPPDAVATLPPGAKLALALPEGSVLTSAHLDPAGPSAGLAADLRVVPVPVEPGWGMEAGGWVDVWVLGMDEEPAALAARSRPVLALSSDEGGRATALLALEGDQVRAVTAGLAHGRVLLAHAPAP